MKSFKLTPHDVERLHRFCSVLEKACPAHGEVLVGHTTSGHGLLAATGEDGSSCLLGACEEALVVMKDGKAVRLAQPIGEGTAEDSLFLACLTPGLLPEAAAIPYEPDLAYGDVLDASVLLPLTSQEDVLPLEAALDTHIIPAAIAAFSAPYGMPELPGWYMRSVSQAVWRTHEEGMTQACHDTIRRSVPAALAPDLSASPAAAVAYEILPAIRDGRVSDMAGLAAIASAAAATSYGAAAVDARRLAYHVMGRLPGTLDELSRIIAGYLPPEAGQMI